MADPQNEKERITSELARVRNALSDEALLVRRNLDIGRHMSDSMRRHSWGWISIAAVFGWLLSRLPARKKKIYVHTSGLSKNKKSQDRSFGVSLEGRVVGGQTGDHGLPDKQDSRQGEDSRGKVALIVSIAGHSKMFDGHAGPWQSWHSERVPRSQS